jgi:hypothetical protein
MGTYRITPAGDAALKARFRVRRRNRKTRFDLQACRLGCLRHPDLLRRYKCAHSIMLRGDKWPDDIRLSELEPDSFARLAATVAQIADPTSIGMSCRSQ